MSQYEVVEGNIKWLFGWDQPLQSYFIQVHNTDMDEEENPFIWLGATLDTGMYEVEELVRAAKTCKLVITPEMRANLYADKEMGV